MDNKSWIWRIEDKKFNEIISTNTSITNVLLELGLSPNSGSMRNIIRQRINENNIDTSHMKRKQNDNKINYRYSLDEILVENSTYSNITSLKRRLIKEDVLKYKCDICSNYGDWMGKSLTLQLDHIDGNPRNHTLSNLRFLCPNCHSQTHNFSGKNIKSRNVKNKYVKPKKIIQKYTNTCQYCDMKFEVSKRYINQKFCSIACANFSRRKNKRPSKQELHNLLSKKGFTEVGRMFNVSPTTIKKWCKSYEMSVYIKDYTH